MGMKLFIGHPVASFDGVKRSNPFRKSGKPVSERMFCANSTGQSLGTSGPAEFALKPELINALKKIEGVRGAGSDNISSIMYFKKGNHIQADNGIIADPPTICVKLSPLTILYFHKDTNYSFPLHSRQAFIDSSKKNNVSIAQNISFTIRTVEIISYILGDIMHQNSSITVSNLHVKAIRGLIDIMREQRYEIFKGLS
jgi:hypothetical protein